MIAGQRRKPLDIPPIVAGECDYCGSEISKSRYRKYCSAICRVKYNNLCASQGKQLTQAAKHYALGNNPDEMLGIIKAKATDFIREDNERKGKS